MRTSITDGSVYQAASSKSCFFVDTDQQFEQNIKDLMKLTGGTKADVIRRALATYKYLKNEEQRPQTKVSITNADNQVLKDVILP